VCVCVCVHDARRVSHAHVCSVCVCIENVSVEIRYSIFKRRATWPAPHTQRTHARTSNTTSISRLCGRAYRLCPLLYRCVGVGDEHLLLLWCTGTGQRQQHCDNDICDMCSIAIVFSQPQQLGIQLGAGAGGEQQARASARGEGAFGARRVYEKEYKCVSDTVIDQTRARQRATRVLCVYICMYVAMYMFMYTSDRVRG